MSDAIVIDTPEGMAYFRLLQFKYRLRLEIETSMKFSSHISTMKLYNVTFGTNFRRKAAALADCEIRVCGVAASKASAEIRTTCEEILEATWGEGVDAEKTSMREPLWRQCIEDNFEEWFRPFLLVRMGIQD